MRVQRLDMNPDMLSLAREYRGMTQKMLEQKTAIPEIELVHMENGQQTFMSAEMSNAIAQALNFPRSFFKQDEIKVGLGSSSTFAAQKGKITEAKRLRIQSLINLHRIALKKMLSFISIDSPLYIPSLEGGDCSPEEGAEMVRAFWNLPDGPIANVSKLLERAGMIVIECDFNTPHLESTSIWHADTYPLIFINKNLSAEQYRFALAHELGHIVQGQRSQVTQEEADRFAYAFLMPGNRFLSTMKHLQGEPEKEDVTLVSGYWKVSIATLIKRRAQLAKLPQKTRQALNQLSESTIEQDNIGLEKPTLLADIFHAAVTEGGITRLELKDFFGLPDDCLNELYFTLPEVAALYKQPHLRVV